MRRLLAGVAAVLILAAGCTSDPEAPGESRVDVDTPALRTAKAAAGVEPCVPGPVTDGGFPDLTLPCFGGGTAIDLATLQGPLILNYWASSCGPCVDEMPAVQQFYEQYGDQVPVIGLNYADTIPGYAMALVQDSGVTYPLIADPGGKLQGTDLRTLGMPTFAFLGADGEVTKVAGGIDSVDQLVDLVRTNLGITL